MPADAAALSQQLEVLRDQGQRERETLIDELTKTRGEMVQLTTAMSEAPRAAAALRDELAQAHRDLFDERASISRLTDEIEKVRRDADGNAQRFESSRHHLEALASELAQTREALQAREHDFAVVADEVDALRVQIADVQTETDAALRARDQAQRQLSRAQAERDTARHALDVAAAERAAAEEGIRQSGQALQALRDELPRRATAEASLARERDSAMTSLRTVSEKLAAVEAILARTQRLHRRTRAPPQRPCQAPADTGKTGTGARRDVDVPRTSAQPRGLAARACALRRAAAGLSLRWQAGAN